MADIWPVIHAERNALADDLAGLSPQQWQTPSDCAQWSVHDVLAHLLSLSKMTPGRFISRLAGSGFNFNRYTAAQVAIEGRSGPEATLREFRRASAGISAPPGPKATWLGETLVHAEDIRRPLGIAHTYPMPFVEQAIRFYAGSNAIIKGRDRVAGVTLAATDSDFLHGSGPRAQGPAVALMLAATGRRRGLQELTGPGADVLAARFQPA
ncbi:MAG: maleylpyruvate isomerase family mycothiol-dependent enzyme [Actinobacteria bacterium]|nr:maleylpyruvate isomerase family mycothiol-dependent enzyme [Actinomycetota bacterium]